MDVKDFQVSSVIVGLTDGLLFIQYHWIGTSNFSLLTNCMLCTHKLLLFHCIVNIVYVVNICLFVAFEAGYV